MNPKIIGSRGSDLALWQSRTVLAALRKRFAGACLAFRHHGHRHARRPRSVAAARRKNGERVLHARARAGAARPAHRSGGSLAEGSADRRTFEGFRIARYCRAPRPLTGCWCATNFTCRAKMVCCRSRRGTRVGASSLRRGALLGQFAPQAVIRAVARKCTDAIAQTRRRPERRCHRAGRRRAHASAARSVTVRGDRTAARMVGARARAGCPRGAVPQRETRKSKRRLRCLPTLPVSRRRVGSVSSCASSKAAVRRPSAAMSPAIACI